MWNLIWLRLTGKNLEFFSPQEQRRFNQGCTECPFLRFIA